MSQAIGCLFASSIFIGIFFQFGINAACILLASYWGWLILKDIDLDSFDFRWTWDKIRSLGNTKALRTSFLFLFIVPLVARTLTDVPEKLDVGPFIIPMELPFSWIVLYVCSIVVSIGNLTYIIRCPDFLKNYSNFVDFQASERNCSVFMAPLQQSLNVDGFEVMRKRMRERAGRNLPTAPRGKFPALWLVEGIARQEFPDRVDTYIIATNPDAADATLYRSVRLQGIVEQFKKPDQPEKNSYCGSEEILAEAINRGYKAQPDFFYFVRDAASHCRPKSRLVATIAYLLGFLCLGIIAGQNIMFVVTYFIAER